MWNLLAYFNGGLRAERSKTIYAGKMKQTGFIVGTGRCGTTILASVLNAHPNICIPHELHFLVNRGIYETYLSGDGQRFQADDFISFIQERNPYHFERYFDYIGHFKNLTYPQKNLRLLLTDLFDHICYVSGKETFLDQTPWHGQYLEILKEVFPDMKVIHMIRDGRDVAISFARTPWWGKEKDLMANLERWRKEISVIHSFCVNNPAICLEVKYEDLVVNPRQELGRILRLFGLEFEEEMLDPAHLIDYMPFSKGNGMEVQSERFKKWEQEKDSVFFPESILNWKNTNYESFRFISDDIKETLLTFGYDA